MSKWIIYGTGKSAEYCIDYLNEIQNYFPSQIIAVCDGNSEKWGKLFRNFKIISPDEADKLQYDYILVASVYFEEIQKNLLKKGVPEQRIIDKEELGALARRKFAQLQYQQHEKKCPCLHRYPAVSSKRIVVYTANFGGYDHLYDPQVVDSNIDYVCFTDNKEFHSKVWNVEYVDTSDCSDFPLKVRKYKLKPYKYFKEYETSVWLDSSLEIVKDLRDYIKKYSKKSPMLCFPHSARNSIYEEAKKCIELNKGNKEDIIRQITAYKNEGYLDNLEMAECTCLVRSHHNEELINVMEDWWNELLKYSKRDQISFPYVCRKNNFYFDFSDQAVFDCEYFKYRGHL